MATVNPSIVRAYVESQDCFNITYPQIDTHQTFISNVSKASTAVVSLGSATTVVSTTGTVGTIAGTGPYTAVISGMTTTAGLLTGQNITATAGTGNLGVGTTYVSSIIGNDSIGITSSATTNAGTITNVSIATPTKIPAGMVDGTEVIIEDVGGMTQLATAGVDGSNKFYANIASVTTFELYTDAALTTGVDSSSFTNATANTGYVQIYTVPQYNNVGSSATVVFSQDGPAEGTAISLDTATGVFSLAADLTYTMTATAEINVAGATYQWYDVTSTPSAIGSSAPVGTPVTAVYLPADPADVALVVTAADGTTLSYPTQITNAQAVVQVASGFVA